MTETNGEMNRTVHYVLMVGSVASYIILLTGMALLVPALGPGPWGLRLLSLALASMIAVPFLRVVAVTFQYGWHKRYTFFLISLLVLVILCTSLLQGIR
jgi:uncharacterized membrane protein